MNLPLKSDVKEFYTLLNSYSYTMEKAIQSTKGQKQRRKGVYNMTRNKKHEYELTMKHNVIKTTSRIVATIGGNGFCQLRENYILGKYDDTVKNSSNINLKHYFGDTKG